MSHTTRVRFHAADGVLLRGRLRLPAGRPHGVAVLCHPHPVFGGHMDVWLLPTIGERLADEGWAVLRFDFRGVGHGGPEGPADDAAVADLTGAVDLVHRTTATADRCAVVGWSFGALVALHHGLGDPRVTDWVGIAPPTGPTPGVHLPCPPRADIGCWQARRTAIVGDHDQFFPADQVDALAPHEVRILTDADHFLFDRDGEVAGLVAEVVS